MDVTKSMMIALVTPVVAVVLGMLVLKEELSWRTILGGAMIMAGIGIIVVARVKGFKQSNGSLKKADRLELRT